MSTATRTDYHPEEHMNEEPRNDFIDVGLSAGIAAAFFIGVSIVATIITIFLK